MEVRGEFVDYIKRVENGAKLGYTDGFWFPHPSPEGGNDTIGYGHKLLDSEDWMKEGISDEENERLLYQDIFSASENAAEVINEYGSDNFEDLPQHCQEIFTDFVFNLGSNGLRKFPKFVTATVYGDMDGMREEYKRYYRTPSGEVRELEDRNREFYNLFLA